MLNLFLVIDVLIIAPLLVLAITVLLHGGYKHHRNVLLALFSLFISLWIVANHVGNDLATPADIAVIANYFVFSCSFAAMILIMVFVIRLTELSHLKKIMNVSLPIVILMAILAATPLVGQGVIPQEGLYEVVFGPLVIPYGIVLIYMISLTLVAIGIGIRRTRGVHNNQLQVVGASLALSLPAIFLLGFILPTSTGAFWLTEFGVLPTIIIVVGLYYSVIRHRLFDIRFAVVRGVAYVCVLASLAIIYYLLAYIVSVIILRGHVADTVSPINVLLALLLTLIFQPLKLFFDRVTNTIFYRDHYRSVDFIARLNHLLTSTTDLRGLLERVSIEITQTLKSDQAFFFLYLGSQADHYLSAGTSRHAILPLNDARELDEFVMKRTESVFLTDTLYDVPHIRRLLLSHKIAVVVPLRSPVRITGYLLLGEHRSDNYTKRDLNVLSTISSELVIAIQNALSLHEVKELNATLQQRIDVATKELRSSNAQLKHLDEVKDEFMSMASHQLRTPLTSVKGYLSMVLEGDAGDISPQQRKLLVEAYNSSERMVHLIADFLNVSRLQTGKFIIDKQATDLTRIVRQETASLKLIAESRQIKLKHVIPRSSLVVYADEAKVREVVMNFIDNAIFYSRAGSTVTVTLERDGDDALFAVTDQGIGVPEVDQARLFNKFFRAANARKQRPDGTGVGLYLARKVITAHGGSVLFHSVEGKGSTFGFRLPVMDATKLDR